VQPFQDLRPDKRRAESGDDSQHVDHRERYLIEPASGACHGFYRVQKRRKRHNVGQNIKNRVNAVKCHREYEKDPAKRQRNGNIYRPVYLLGVHFIRHHAYADNKKKDDSRYYRGKMPVDPPRYMVDPVRIGLQHVFIIRFLRVYNFNKAKRALFQALVQLDSAIHAIGHGYSPQILLSILTLIPCLTKAVKNSRSV
jgi:hypothetical protein